VTNPIFESWSGAVTSLKYPGGTLMSLSLTMISG